MKRTAFLLGALLCLALQASADERITAQDSYIKKYADIAVDEMNRSGVPASITLAQGLIESAAGQSRLAVLGNNHFGIKCHNDWKGKTMRADDDRPNECFRVYGTPEESFRDHSDFLRYRDRYKFLFDLEITDYKGWAHGLKKAGYATAPTYAERLIEYIEKYKLTRFDTCDESPESPLRIEADQPFRKQQDEEIRFSLTRPVFTRNGVPFVYAARGDTYRSLAQENGLFFREILKYNDAGRKDVLQPGDIVYLQLKKKSAPKGLDKYIVDTDGESLRDISQRFGLRLSAILDMNGMAADYPLFEGDVLLLRKP